MFESYNTRRAEEEGLDLPKFRPSQEYVEGLKKLDFEHNFSSGETFKAVEDESGKASFFIQKNGKKIFDFKNLSPEEIKFVTPTYWKNLDNSDEYAPRGFRENPNAYREQTKGRWGYDAKFISVGEITSLKDVIFLLHEIGHSKEDIGQVIKWRKAIQKDEKVKAAELSSESERFAWSEALKMGREMKKNLGINIFEDFSNIDDIKELIYTSLSTQRYSAEADLSGIPEGLLRKIVLEILKINPKSKESESLDQLFDKRKLVKE